MLKRCFRGARPILADDGTYHHRGVGFQRVAGLADQSPSSNARTIASAVPVAAQIGGRPPCSAPLESSHLSDFVRPEIARAPIAQCLVWALFVVPADPRGQLTPRVVEAGEVVLPDTF